MIFAASIAANQSDVCYYAGSSGKERFYCTLALSDGSILVGGMASDLGWVPASATRIQLAGTAQSGGAAPAYDSADATQGKYAFIALLSSDGKTVRKVYHFPVGFGGCIQTIKTNSVPGAVTGDLYVSGFWTNAGSGYGPAFYWLGKLDKNILAGDPAGLAWIYPDCAAGGDRFMQLWDVGGDGKIVYSNYKSPGMGAWHAVQRLQADGSGLDIVAQWSDYGAGYASALSLKPGNGDMRSLTQADYDLVFPDGHGGNGRKKGKFPYDYYYAGPKGINDAGGGFTGYSSDGKAATTVAIAIDRRDNTMYIGFNNSNPQNTHDFEPMAVAFKPDGEQLWYSHLYTVWNDTNGNNIVDAGETFQCPPDQYVDGMAIDYSRPVGAPEIVVLARCHGNAPNNYWSGVNSFHNGFTGTNGNEHLGWLGRFKGADGTFINASWQAEYDPFTTNFGSPYADPNLDGWPDHNSGWPGLKTTKSRSLSIDASGNILVVATSRGPVTTANAFQKATKPTATTKGCWADFARLFKSDFSTLVYSSTLSDPWDSTTGNGGGNIHFCAAEPVAGGIIVVGYHMADSTNTALGAGPMPTSNVPSWASATPNGESAVFAKLMYTQAPVLEQPASRGALGRPRAAQWVGSRLVIDMREYPRPAGISLFTTGGRMIARAYLRAGMAAPLSVDRKPGAGVLFVRIAGAGVTQTVPLLIGR
jgi:hypothetical protein